MTQAPMTALDVIHWKQSNKTRESYLLGVGIDVAQHPHNAQMVHNLGRQLFYCGFEASALKVLNKHLEMEFSVISRRSLSACFIAQIWIKRGETEQNRVKNEIAELRKLNREPDEPTIIEMAKRVSKLYDNARDAFLRAFQLDCNWRAPLMGLADLALRMQDYNRAIVWVAAAEAITRSSPIGENAAHYTYAPDEILMKAYFGLWKEANRNKQSNTQELFSNAYEAWKRCKDAADWLPSVVKFSEIFQYDENYAHQSVSSGDFKE